MASCVHTGTGGPSSSSRLAPREPEPVWMDLPLSWNKLDQIEAWLESSAVDSDSSFRIEAELQLAEGRLEFAERDLRSSNVPSPSVSLRLRNSREAFEALLAHQSELTPPQRARVESGRHRSMAFPVVTRADDLRIVKRGEWGARLPVTGRLTPLRGAWSRITVHHSAETSSTDEGGSFEDSKRTMRLIQEHHIERNAWGDVGYHYIIDAAGRIFEGRDDQWQGAHAGGENNYQNIGICLLGSFENGRPSDAALKSLELLLDSLRAENRIPAARVLPHRAYGSTLCPGDSVARWIRDYQRR